MPSADSAFNQPLDNEGTSKSNGIVFGATVGVILNGHAELSYAFCSPAIREYILAIPDSAGFENADSVFVEVATGKLEGCVFGTEVETGFIGAPPRSVCVGEAFGRCHGWKLLLSTGTGAGWSRSTTDANMMASPEKGNSFISYILNIRITCRVSII